jgi:hypothetical protein
MKSRAVMTARRFLPPWSVEARSQLSVHRYLSATAKAIKPSIDQIIIISVGVMAHPPINSPGKGGRSEVPNCRNG